MITLNNLINQLQKRQISFFVIENFISSQNINDEVIVGLDNNNRNALHNSLLLFLDCETESEDEYTYDPHEENWDTSDRLIKFTANKIKLINQLISFKKNDKDFLNQQDINGNSPLHLAVIKQCVIDWRFIGEFSNIAKRLINNPDVNPNLINFKNKTPFCILLTQKINKIDSYPTANEIREIVDEFQKNANFNINCINNNKQNLLHIIAKNGSKTDFKVNFAITKESNFYQIDINGYTPYEIAILNNNFDMLSIIENYKHFDINATIDEFNNTILHRAIRWHNKKIINTLLSKYQNYDLEINFNIKNKKNEKPFKFEDMIINWLKNSLRDQNETEIKIIDFLRKNECDYNNYITREKLTWWTLAIRYNFKMVTNYLVDSVLTNINKIDKNPFNDKRYFFNDEVKNEINSMLDDLSYVEPEIITTIKKLPNCPNFNELQKNVLAQRVNGFDIFKQYQSVQDLSDYERAILKIYVDAILDDEENWTLEKEIDFNTIKIWLSEIKVEANTNYSFVNHEQKTRNLTDEKKDDDNKRRKLSLSYN